MLTYSNSIEKTLAEPSDGLLATVFSIDTTTYSTPLNSFPPHVECVVGRMKPPPTSSVTVRL